jgi:hypothetical protein
VDAERKDTQCDMVLAALKAGETVTPITALAWFGCFRLAARINDLRRRGHRICRVDIRSGRKRYAGYTMEDR